MFGVGFHGASKDRHAAQHEVQGWEVRELDHQ